MRKLLLASHGFMAKGVLNSINIIIGDTKCVDILCAYVDEDNDIDLLVNQATAKMKEDPSLEWIVVTDIFGGSVNNAFMNKLGEYHFHLISGLNLPLLLDLLSSINSKKDTRELIEQSLKASKSTIQYCNDLKNSNIIEEDF